MKAPVVARYGSPDVVQVRRVPKPVRAIEVSQDPRPLSPLLRIARADVAETFVEALERPGTSNTTFEVVWGRGPRKGSWDELLRRLKPDA